MRGNQNFTFSNSGSLAFKYVQASLSFLKTFFFSKTVGFEYLKCLEACTCECTYDHSARMLESCVAFIKSFQEEGLKPKDKRISTINREFKIVVDIIHNCYLMKQKKLKVKIFPSIQSFPDDPAKLSPTCPNLGFILLC